MPDFLGTDQRKTSDNKNEETKFQGQQHMLSRCRVDYLIDLMVSMTTIFQLTNN